MSRNRVRTQSASPWASQIEVQAIAALRPRRQNPRTHSKKQIRQIADSIEAFGFTNPVLVDDRNGVIAGHGRIEAAKLLGFKEVPTIRLDQLSEEQVRAYVIADNRLAETAGWDREILALEFQDLSELDLDFEITVTGFETPEIDLLITELDAGPESEPAEPELEPASGPCVTRPGDLWKIGRHRLFCGDATDPRSYQHLLDGAKAQMVFTDPPYNVQIDGHVSGLGAVKHREFAMASGEMSEEEFAGFLESVFRNLAEVSASGAIHFICMDWRHIAEILAAAKVTYTEFKNLCVWAKTNGGMGSLYRSQHELIFVFKAGRGAHINNVELGKYGRYRTNLWTYAGANTFRQGRDEDLAVHPTVKPTALVADAIHDCSKRGGLVLDPFAGSGTTLLAAEKTGRRGYGMEIDPHYCDLVLRRLEQMTGKSAIHHETGRSFSDEARRRLSSSPAAPRESSGVSS